MADALPTYWQATRLPIPCLAFVLPMLLIYEWGVARLGGASSEALRSGADAWMRQALAAVGLRDGWLLPLALIGTLLGWQAFRSGPWRFRPWCLIGMGLESLVLALGLVGLGRLVEMGFDRLGTGPLLEAASAGASTSLGPVIGFLGAGIFEETLFRLAMIPLLYKAARLAHAPETLAGTIAIAASSVAFSLAHHAGMPGEVFTSFAFTFRWLAGIVFAWVFLVRGFGVAVGTHVAYDVLVGCVGLHF